MKILHLGKFSPFFQGGIETFLHDLNNTLAQKQGITSDVLCLDKLEKSKIQESVYNIYRTAIDFTISNAPVSVRYLQWVKQNIHNYDLIHLHHPNPMANIALLLSDFKGKVVVHWHSDIVKKGVLERANTVIIKKMLERADKIIVTSPNYSLDSLVLKTYPHKTVMIPLGFDTNRLAGLNPKKLAVLKEQYKGKRIIFALGRLVEFKGYEYLIKAATYLPKDYIILMGGDGILYKHHQKLIKTCQVEDKVQLLGLVTGNDAAYYFTLCNLFVVPSITRAESFGMVLLEAMSFRKPMISTNISNSGVNWVNQDGVTGLVIPCKDSAAMAYAIQILCQNEAQLQQFGWNAYQRFKENFDIEIIADKIIALYQHLLEDKKELKNAFTDKNRDLPPITTNITYE